VRLSKQSFLVVADHAAAGGGASANCFESLFGEGGSMAERQAALRKKASLLDWFNEDIARLNRKLGPGDRARVSQYLDTVREVERRIQKADADAAEHPLRDLDRPVGVPAAYADHARLMFDCRCWRCRAMSRASSRSNSRAKRAIVLTPRSVYPIRITRCRITATIRPRSSACRKINAFHVSLFAEFLGKLQATPEGNGTLLDHSLYLYGSGIGNPNIHDHTNLPISSLAARPAD
jgi:hypothetical protein